jgi:carboxyl-terminal processing protease
MTIQRKILFSILVVLVFLAGYSFGSKGIFKEQIPSQIVNRNLGQDSQVDFSLYWQVWDKVKDKYLGEPDPQQSVYGAIKGMVASLRDPFSVFFTPEESDKFFQDLSGEFEGIGAELAIRDEKLIVVSPLEDSPAEEAGLKPKDVILRIDDVDAATISFDEAITNIRGEKGSQVRLLIQRQGIQEPFEIKITRATIRIDSVRSKIREDGIGIIKIIQFSQRSETLSDTKKAIREMERAGVKGIVLDLRNNPGGLLRGAINVASLIIPKGVVVIEEGKDGKRTEFSTTQNQIGGGIPLVVLVNEGTASASEIVAGAIKDSGRGKIVGVKTFGKGTVQDVIEFKDGSNLKVTVAHWLTPSGIQIDKTGIEPDETVERTVDDISADCDPQLDRAIELLR